VIRKKKKEEEETQQEAHRPVRAKESESEEFAVAMCWDRV